MNTGDYTAIAVLGAFGLMGALGWFRWAGRIVGAVLIGCVVLILLGGAGSIPGYAQVRDVLAGVRIPQVVTRQADSVLQRLGLRPSKPADEQAAAPSGQQAAPAVEAPSARAPVFAPEPEIIPADVARVASAPPEPPPAAGQAPPATSTHSLTQARRELSELVEAARMMQQALAEPKFKADARPGEKGP